MHEDKLTKSAPAACESCCSAADRMDASAYSSALWTCDRLHMFPHGNRRYAPGESVPVRTALMSMLGW